MKTNENENKVFCLTIPDQIAFDNRLVDKAKLLYGIIYGLAHAEKNKFGYCFSANKFFSEKLKVHQTNITRYISALSELGYIKVVYDRSEKNNTKRKLYTTDIQNVQGGISKNADTVPAEMLIPSKQNCVGGISKNADTVPAEMLTSYIHSVNTSIDTAKHTLTDTAKTEIPAKLNEMDFTENSHSAETDEDFWSESKNDIYF